jgi:membrane protein
MGLVWRAVRSYVEHGGAVYAAAMSYYVLFSLFPLLIFAVALLGVLLRDPAMQDRIVSAIVNEFPPSVNLHDQVESLVSGVPSSYASVLGLMGLLAAVWTATGVFGTLRRALNRAFDLPGTQSFIHGKLTDLVSIVGATGLVVLSITTTAALRVFRTRAEEQFAGWPVTMAWGVVTILAPLGLSFVTFLLVYWLVPHVRVHQPALWVGALLAALGFELAKAGFGLYVVNFGRYQEVYGTLGGAVVFLFFVYVVASIVIFAAEVAAELAKGWPDTTGPPTSHEGPATPNSPLTDDLPVPAPLAGLETKPSSPHPCAGGSLGEACSWP